MYIRQAATQVSIERVYSSKYRFSQLGFLLDIFDFISAIEAMMSFKVGISSAPCQVTAHLIRLEYYFLQLSNVVKRDTMFSLNES